MYSVTYHDTEQTALIDRDAIDALGTEEVTMDDVRENCDLYRLDAELFEGVRGHKSWIYYTGSTY